MKTLLLIAHGSRIASANEYVAELATELKNNPLLKVEFVDYAFLEFGDRPPLDRVRDLIARGVKEFVCFPLFLSEGKHVSKDIPKLKRDVESEFPQIVFNVTTHLGGVSGIGQLIVEESLTASPHEK